MNKRLVLFCYKVRNVGYNLKGQQVNAYLEVESLKPLTYREIIDCAVTFQYSHLCEIGFNDEYWEVVDSYNEAIETEDFIVASPVIVPHQVTLCPLRNE